MKNAYVSTERRKPKALEIETMEREAVAILGVEPEKVRGSYEKARYNRGLKMPGTYHIYLGNPSPTGSIYYYASGRGTTRVEALTKLIAEVSRLLGFSRDLEIAEAAKREKAAIEEGRKARIKNARRPFSDALSYARSLDRALAKLAETDPAFSKPTLGDRTGDLITKLEGILAGMPKEED